MGRIPQAAHAISPNSFRSRYMGCNSFRSLQNSLSHGQNSSRSWENRSELLQDRNGCRIEADSQARTNEFRLNTTQTPKYFNISYVCNCIVVLISSVFLPAVFPLIEYRRAPRAFQNLLLWWLRFFRRSQLSTIRVVLLHNIDQFISFNLPKSFFVSWQKGVPFICSFVDTVVGLPETLDKLQWPIFLFERVIFCKGSN